MMFMVFWRASDMNVSGPLHLVWERHGDTVSCCSSVQVVDGLVVDYRWLRADTVTKRPARRGFDSTRREVSPCMRLPTDLLLSSKTGHRPNKPFVACFREKGAGGEHDYSVPPDARHKKLPDVLPRRAEVQRETDGRRPSRSMGPSLGLSPGRVVVAVPLTLAR